MRLIDKIIDLCRRDCNREINNESLCFSFSMHINEECVVCFIPGLPCVFVLSLPSAAPRFMFLLETETRHWWF